MYVCFWFLVAISCLRFSAIPNLGKKCSSFVILCLESVCLSKKFVVVIVIKHLYSAILIRLPTQVFRCFLNSVKGRLRNIEVPEDVGSGLEGPRK